MAQRNLAELRVATDIGGTFTDLIAIENGRVRSVKRRSTPGQFAHAIKDALRAGEVDLPLVGFFAHGSTVVINALTERKGVKTGLLTTSGFGDVLEIARGNTPDIFNAYYRKPPPFVPKRLRREVRERISPQGQVLRALVEEDLADSLAGLLEQGVEAIAVCFLHAYANPAHELQALELIAGAAPGIEAVASHQVSRQWREYERSSSTVLSAYVLPPTRAYLQELRSTLNRGGLRGEPFIMQSNGGLVDIATAAANPISLVESGPVAGVLGAAAYGKLIGEPNLLTLDIGGTTAKCSLVQQGEARITHEYFIEKSPLSTGYPITTPVVDIVEIGNGGGSIAWLDAAGSLHVGPESAGAHPGPVAYGLGGDQPTTTDAHLLLGRIDPKRLAGTEHMPEMDAVRRAFARLAKPLGLDALAAARGVVRIANANMANALKLVSLNRGHDPRDFALLAFGGGAGLHALALARELSVPKVVIPPHSAVFSAWAMLLVDERRDFLLTRVVPVQCGAVGEIDALFAKMERESMAEGARSQETGAQWEFRRYVDMRYAGQEHTVKLAYESSGTQQLLEAFHRAHEREFTFRLDSPAEVVNLHLALLRRSDGAAPQPMPLAEDPDPAAARTGSRTVYFDGIGDMPACVYERAGLVSGMALTGPAIIECADSVTLAPPGARGTVDAYGGLQLQWLNGGSA